MLIVTCTYLVVLDVVYGKNIEQNVNFADTWSHMVYMANSSQTCLIKHFLCTKSRKEQFSTRAERMLCERGAVDVPLRQLFVHMGQKVQTIMKVLFFLHRLN